MGDKRLWSDLQRDYALYFINLDTILGNQGTLTESCKEKLMQLQNRGATFVGYTVENEEYKQLALLQLHQRKTVMIFLRNLILFLCKGKNGEICFEKKLGIASNILASIIHTVYTGSYGGGLEINSRKDDYSVVWVVA